MGRCYFFQSSYTRNKLKNERMILRGGLVVCYLFNVLLALLFLIHSSFAMFSLSFVLFCFLPPPLSLVPSLLAYFPSAFGKSSKEKGQNKNQNSCKHTGPSSFSTKPAAFGRAPFQQGARGTVRGYPRGSPAPSAGAARGRGWRGRPRLALPEDKARGQRSSKET